VTKDEIMVDQSALPLPDSCYRLLSLVAEKESKGETSQIKDIPVELTEDVLNLCRKQGLLKAWGRSTVTPLLQDIRRRVIPKAIRDAEVTSEELFVPDQVMRPHLLRLTQKGRECLAEYRLLRPQPPTVTPQPGAENGGADTASTPPGTKPNDRDADHNAKGTITSDASNSSPSAVDKLDRILARKALHTFTERLMRDFVKGVQVQSLMISDAEDYEDACNAFRPEMMRFAGAETSAVFDRFMTCALRLDNEVPRVFGPSKVPGRYTSRISLDIELRPDWQKQIRRVYLLARHTYQAWAKFVDLVRRKWPDLILELHGGAGEAPTPPTIKMKGEIMESFSDEPRGCQTGPCRLPNSAFSMLDRYPATPAGHIAFIEWVRDEVHLAADSKRNQAAKGYSNDTLARTVGAIKWPESQHRSAALRNVFPAAVDQIVQVLGQELNIGTVERLDELLRPAVKALREAWEQSRNDSASDPAQSPILPYWKDLSWSDGTPIGLDEGPQTLGDLLRSLERADDALRQCMAQVARNTPDASWWRMQAQTFRFRPNPDRSPGIDVLETLCHAEFSSELNLENTRRLRSKLILKAGLSPADVDSMTIQQAADAFRSALGKSDQGISRHGTSARDALTVALPTETDDAATTKPAHRTCRVFISYSHDSPEHCDQVLRLANALRNHGVDAELDRFHVRPPEGWPLWCERQLRPENDDFVLMICTRTYRDRVENKVSADEGRGVFWEGRIIYDYIYDAKGNTRFIPVLFVGGNMNYIPMPIRNHTRYQIGQLDLTDDGFQSLYRELTGQPAVAKPPLGHVVALATHPPSVAPLAPRAVETTFPTNAATGEKIGDEGKATCEATETEIIVEALQSAREVLSACEQENALGGPQLFLRAMAELWKSLAAAAKWGNPGQIDRKLRQFIGVYAAIPEPVAGLHAASYHELGLGIATRVAVAGANAAKAVTFLENGITAESLMSSGATDLAQAMALDEARSGFDANSLARNWERIRQAVRKIVTAFDAMYLSACIRDESVRAGRNTDVHS
jgi:hypothetical protein